MRLRPAPDPQPLGRGPGEQLIASGNGSIAAVDPWAFLGGEAPGADTRRRGWVLRPLLLIADVLGLSLACLVAEWAVGGRTNSGVIAKPEEILAFLATLPLWLAVVRAYGLYERDEARTDHSSADEFSSVFHMVTVCTAGTAAVSSLTRFVHPSPSKLIAFWFAAICLVVVARAIVREYARRCPWFLQNTLIVGAGDVGQSIAHKLLQHPEYGANLVGFVDDEPKARRDDLEDLTIVGEPSELDQLVRSLDIERVIVSFSGNSDTQTLDLVRRLSDLDVRVDVVPRLFELVTPGVEMHSVEGIPLVGLPPRRLPRSSRALKRAFDLVAGVLAALVLLPFMAIVAIAIKIDSRGPVLFRQTRMGSNETPFTIVKFRTMQSDAELRKAEVAHLNRHLGSDGRMFKIPSDPRVTRVGAFLRRTSIDELPQLWNVLKGEMSLVGPRPLILEEDEYVREWARHRLALKPGMTGLWQVLGRSDIPFGEMVRLDYLYVTSWTLAGDVKLIAKTVPRLLRPRNTT
jgi:exopolysaccharide biosynthesis polyprenyl glycosylphosphotransferase